jgi:hypothetical protein
MVSGGLIAVDDRRQNRSNGSVGEPMRAQSEALGVRGAQTKRRLRRQPTLTNR